MMQKLSLLLVLLAGNCPLSAAEPTVFQVHEVTLTANTVPADPLNRPPRAVVTAPGNRVVHVELFWDGGTTWKFRYMPEAPGAHRWAVQSADPSLRGKRGAFTAQRNPAAALELERLGPPRISSDRRHFVHADGTPWFWLADTAWNGALLASDEEWDTYLARRAAQRYTAIQVVLTQWRAAMGDETGRTAFQNKEGAAVTIDPVYFQRMDRRISAINRHGLVAVPVMLWALTGPAKESPGASLPEGECIRLASYLRARYGAHAVLWFLGGDGDYRDAKAAKWKNIGRAVFPPELFRRPVTLHPGGTHDPWPGLVSEPWVDYIAYQSGHGLSPAKWRWMAEKGMAAAWKLNPPRPVIDTEPNYEAHASYNSKVQVTDFHVRRATWTALLAAPVAGITYGAHGIWPWMKERGVPLNHRNSGEADPWEKCMDYPGGAQMTIVRNVLERMEWHNLRPARELVEGPAPDENFSNYVPAARTTGGRAALLYSPVEQELLLDLSAFRVLVNATWIDPRTGDRQPAGRYPARAGTAVQVPAGGDWLLLLEN